VAQKASDSHFERHFRVIIEGFRVIIEGFRVSIELETDSLLYPVLLDSDGHGPAGQIYTSPGSPSPKIRNTKFDETTSMDHDGCHGKARR
jgi:hypothetical protein